MGVTARDHHHHHHHSPPPTNFVTKKLVYRLIYALLPFAVLHFFFLHRPLQVGHLSATVGPPSPPSLVGASADRGSPPAIPAAAAVTAERRGKDEKPGAPPPCDLSVGRWVSTTAEPPYNGTTCATIKDGQNCMAHGRPDTGYLHWRWRPRGCTLRPFDAADFHRLLRGRHLAFVGDSMARNQLESLLCLLATAAPPDLVYRSGDDNKFRRWHFPTYNTTVSVFWSPFLVRGVEKSGETGLDHNQLYLDEVDDRWASALPTIDMVVLSVGHWFLHPAVFYENGGEVVVGCHYCPKLNHTEVGFYGVYQRAFRTALRAAVHGAGSRYVVVTTFSPAHFEGEWDKAGACPKTGPETGKAVGWMDAEMRRRQVAEVEGARRRAAERVDVEALDVTGMAAMRPDGHPGPYMYAFPFANGVPERVQNDCVHWCLPGPIDAWNEVLLEMLRRRAAAGHRRPRRCE